MMKKFFAITLIFALVATVFSGCSLNFNFGQQDMFSGNYKEATPEQKAEVEEKVQKLVDLEEQALENPEIQRSNMKLNSTVTSSYSAADIVVKTTDIFDYHDIDSIKLSEQVETEVKYSGRVGKYVFSMFGDTSEPFLYISYSADNAGDKKDEKGRLELPSQSIDYIKSLFNTGNTTLTIKNVLDSMKLVEVKVSVDGNKACVSNITEIIQGENMEVEYYIIFENDNSYSCKKIFKGKLENTVPINGEITLVPTTETADPPANIEEYSKYFTYNDVMKMVAMGY